MVHKFVKGLNYMQRSVFIFSVLILVANLLIAQVNNDIQMVSFADEAGRNVSIYIPSVFIDDRNLAKLIGKRLFGKNTLYYQKRRIEAYEHAIREIVQMPITTESNAVLFKSIIRNFNFTSQSTSFFNNSSYFVLLIL